MKQRVGILRVSLPLLAQSLGAPLDEEGNFLWRIEFAHPPQGDIYNQNHVDFRVSGEGCPEVEEGEVIPVLTGETTVEYIEDEPREIRRTVLKGP